MQYRELADQAGRTVNIPVYPQRIISLVPSITELLFDLNLDERIAGVTKFCVHPLEKCKSKLNIGGTKKLHLDKIREQEPELIIANKEENTREEIEALAAEFPVWISNVITLEDAYELIDSIGIMTQTTELAAGINLDIRNAFFTLKHMPELEVVYLIWKSPLMAAGNNTFINSLIESTGLKNAVVKDRYPEVHLNNINADLILLSSEPYPFKGQDMVELQETYPQHNYIFVDGEYFSWYGSRLRKFPAYINSIFSDLRSSQK